MTTSNELDPTASSILLAKRLAFPSALNSPVNLNNPKPLEPAKPPGTTSKNRAHGMKRHIGNWGRLSGP
jgi:hypothetical protein